jgi:propanol-preferring alcohol dehydrogenase
MRAVHLVETGPLEREPLRRVDAAVPEVGPGQVLIKVEACGVCRSNLHMVEGDWVPFGVPSKLPIIPGHEVVGVVTETGAGVDEPAVGERVGVQPLWSSCGRCDHCLKAREELCLSKETTGETVDGGYAEYLLAMAAHVYGVPGELDSAAAAPLFCPGITAYAAVAHARLAPGRTVALFGFGGVGHMVVQFARLAGAEVVVVARSPLHLQAASSTQAVRTIDASRDDAGALLARDGGGDAAIVFAPSSTLARQAVQATKNGGVVVLGVHADLGELHFFESKTIVGSVIGNRAQMREVLRLAAAGRVGAEVETFPLDDAIEVLRRLKRGDIRTRAVLVA